MQEIDVFDFLAGQMQELALADADDLQIRLEQRIRDAISAWLSRTLFRLASSACSIATTARSLATC